MEVTVAEELAKYQKSISVAEFFEKNRKQVFCLTFLSRSKEPDRTT